MPVVIFLRTETRIDSYRVTVYVDERDISPGLTLEQHAKIKAEVGPIDFVSDKDGVVVQKCDIIDSMEVKLLAIQ